MKFKKLSKGKRTQLILVIVGTVLILGGLGFGLIKSQYNSIRQIGLNKMAKETTLVEMQNAIKNAEQIENELATVARTLSDEEKGMASGDLYSWFIDTIRQFKLSYKVDVPQVSQPGVSDVTLLPRFPYRQSTASVVGTAYFHDLGKFVADFENEFPHIRLVNLDIDPASVGSGEQEKLSFRMDMIALVKPDQK